MEDNKNPGAPQPDLIERVIAAEAGRASPRA